MSQEECFRSHIYYHTRNHIKTHIQNQIEILIVSISPPHMTTHQMAILSRYPELPCFFETNLSNMFGNLRYLFTNI